MNAHRTNERTAKKENLSETKQSRNVQKLNINYKLQQFRTTNNITLYATTKRGKKELLKQSYGNLIIFTLKLKELGVHSIWNI